MVWTTSINLFVRPIFVPNKDSSIKQLDLFCNITIQLGHGYKPNFKLTGYGPPNGLRRETINKPGCFCTVYWWLKVYRNFLLQFNSIQFNSIEPRKVSGDWVVRRFQNTNTFCRGLQAHLEMTQLWKVIRSSSVQVYKCLKFHSSFSLRLSLRLKGLFASHTKKVYSPVILKYTSKPKTL